MLRAACLIGFIGLAACTSRALDLLPGMDAPVDFAPSRDDLAGHDLAHAHLDLAGVDLIGVDLASADLAGVDLAGHCGDNDVLVGTACVKHSCEVGDSRLDCIMSDGTIGHCANRVCTQSDFLSDPVNCGVLGMVCPAGTPCTNGFCYGACTANSCPSGLVCSEYGCALPSCDGTHDYDPCYYAYTQPDFAAQCCGTKCAHLFSDNKNCGYCGHVCPGNAVCNFGVCDVDCTQAADDTACGSGGGYCCNGTCVALGIGCGCGVSCFSDCFTNGCTAGHSCVTYGFGPMAVCAPDSCSGQPLGTVCAVDDADSVPQGGNCCENGCADLQNDAQNCGACGRACPASEICLRGDCVPPVACDQTSDGTDCRLANGVAGECCGGVCVDTHTDDQNCDGCGLACPVGASCHGWGGDATHQGRCEDGSGTAVGCDASNPCPVGWACVYGGLCVPTDCTGRADGTTCDLGLCCSGACVALTDVNNCGGCGRGCPPGTNQCEFQECVDASYDPIRCSDTATCPADNLCVHVQCVYTTCAREKCFPSSCTGRSDGAECAFGPGSSGTCCDGACVSTDRDPQNCGACGRACEEGLCNHGRCDAGAITRCVPACAAGTICYEVGPFSGTSEMGVCVGPVCGLITYNNPQLDSGRCLSQDGDLGQCCTDGTCADLAHDQHNCGGCGVDCGGAACVDGTCGGAACGYAQQGAFCGARDGSQICCGTSCVDITSDAASPCK